jgi:hypothetical protein
MFQNYLKMAWRDINKRKIFSVINICELAIGMSAGLLITLQSGVAVRI